MGKEKRMGLLSSSVALTRYRVDGRLEGAVLEQVAEALATNAIVEIDEDPAEKSVGWTSHVDPYTPDFGGSSFAIGSYMHFCMRIDKKAIPAKVVRKQTDREIARKLVDSGREGLSRAEKQDIREAVLDRLATRIPATPNVYDVVWHHEAETLWFFSTQKAANEELETLFARSFGLTLIRLFPYTLADLAMGLSSTEKDDLAALSPITLRE
jgi:DNA recombination-dependent growth factor C